jgi:hypothetical protein
MQLPPVTFEEAREQAAEQLGFVASERIQVGNEIFEIPNPSLLDDEQQTRHDQLQFESESWERHPDTLNDDGSVKVRGALKEPHRKDGQLVENYNIQLAKAIFGKRYSAYKAAGGRANDLAVIWWKMNKALADRRATDSKSVGSDPDLAVVSDADRVGPVDPPPAGDS